MLEAGGEHIWQRTRARQPLDMVSIEELDALLALSEEDEEEGPADTSYLDFLQARQTAELDVYMSLEKNWGASHLTYGRSGLCLVFLLP